MALHARAMRARLFMQYCRQPAPPIATNHQLSSIRYESDISHLRPSNFNRPLRFRDSVDSKATKSSFNPRQKPVLPDSNLPNHSSSSSSAELQTPEGLPAFFPNARPLYSHPTARQFKPATEDSSIRFTPWVFIKGLFGVKPKAPEPKPAPPPFHIHNNPYRARKTWPPDFTTIHPKQQFHYEKTYRRRAKLKWARPMWNKSVKLVQNTLVVSTLIYFVFLCEPAHDQGTPFDGFRAWFFTKIQNLGALPESTRAEMEKLEQEARSKAERRVKT